jgi:hypothetical protein
MLINKENAHLKKKNKDNLTITADVSDILKVLNNNAYKNNTSSNNFMRTIASKTIHDKNNNMTEEDIDKLFKNDRAKSKNKT